ncbi:polysaccharide deacetylase family protein [Deinococcus cellulosilyticus]|uniref:Polysaccharide deacetylase family sporulation protein PdaB n=1 Tax=Deinococcus cellulosilyticus (strain DSM 18568 / NBRC 106333 / KACC 11606 / 5516J-15) TaxID=1223518 RepID=A0A511N8W8_DEIC1|nr:polysaccharide deacetylase family protein [Deinococcus cellulosilyticus]GEM49274.1 polysaccharide deacetylase family sporulation protein PdaB [Deinococcus cellulosilyticus NBRC 106333 = KACC 11606]
MSDIASQPSRALPQPVLIHQVEVQHRQVAFTFDDGPNPIYTPQVLEMFREVGGKATFYMIGEQMKAHPELTRQVFEAGHEIGNHTFTHPALPDLSPADQRDQLVRTEKLVQQITGQPCRTFRPPYIAINEQVLDLAVSLGYHSIGCVNGEARDWEMPGTEHIVKATLETSTSGSILLFHDGYGDRSQTIAAVRELTRHFAAEGFGLVTVSELLAGAMQRH